jgi:DNA invertase Pin-like site-specific DNA recombinase
MRIGYVRLSPEDPTRQVQRQALQGAGCRRIFEEHARGRTTLRPQRAAAGLKALRAREAFHRSPAAYA